VVEVHPGDRDRGQVPVGGVPARGQIPDQHRLPDAADAAQVQGPLLDTGTQQPVYRTRQLRAVEVACQRAGVLPTAGAEAEQPPGPVDGQFHGACLERDQGLTRGDELLGGAQVTGFDSLPRLDDDDEVRFPPHQLCPVLQRSWQLSCPRQRGDVRGDACSLSLHLLLAVQLDQQAQNCTPRLVRHPEAQVARPLAVQRAAGLAPAGVAGPLDEVEDVRRGEAGGLGGAQRPQWHRREPQRRLAAESVDPARALGPDRAGHLGGELGVRGGHDRPAFPAFS
jgi:hypothetical protein